MKIELLLAELDTVCEIVSAPSSEGGKFVVLKLTRYDHDNETSVCYDFYTESDLAEFIRALKFIKEEAFK